MSERLQPYPSPGRPRTLRPMDLAPISLAVVLLVAACSRRPSGDQAPDILVTLQVQPDPALVGAATLTLVLQDTAGNPVEGAVVTARGDMTHPGMIPSQGNARPESPGTYVIPFEWTMAGEWVLTITGELPDGRRLIRRYEFGVQPGRPE